MIGLFVLTANRAGLPVPLPWHVPTRVYEVLSPPHGYRPLRFLLRFGRRRDQHLSRPDGKAWHRRSLEIALPKSRPQLHPTTYASLRDNNEMAEQWQNWPDQHLSPTNNHNNPISGSCYRPFFRSPPRPLPPFTRRTWRQMLCDQASRSNG